MYRTLIPLLLCASTVSPAPQQNSNITYIKQLDLEYSQPELKTVERESRIENVPLIIPGNLNKEPAADTKTNTETTKTLQANNSEPTYNYSDRIYSIKSKPKTNNSTEHNIPTEEIKETESDHTDDILPEATNSEIVTAESILNDRVATNDNSGLNSEIVTTQSEELVTEKYEEDTTVTTVVEEETTKAPIPRQLAKLSHFGKSTIGSFSQNLITHPEKKRFRSRCRCEKIQNCAKLQISVPRCPSEMFMCCL